ACFLFLNGCAHHLYLHSFPTRRSSDLSNILFGNLQKITSEQLGLPPVLMAAANSSGGVMGKMIDAQSIVVASTATNWYGHEGSRSEEHTSELQSREKLVCRLLLEKKKA